MRHIDPPRAPYGWQKHVRERGRRWLNDPAANNRGAERPESFWLNYRDQIGERFNCICCYTVVWVANGEADHFVPWARVRGTAQAELAYDWTNIRYADSWINRSKGAAVFPDPFTVQDDWFELHLPSLELRTTGQHPATEQAAIDNLLERVRDDHRVMKLRRRYLKQYLDRDRSLKSLEQDAPLLARALRTNPAYLRPDDQELLQAGTL